MDKILNNYIEIKYFLGGKINMRIVNIANNNEYIQTFKYFQFDDTSLCKYFMSQISRCKFEIANDECLVKAIGEKGEIFSITFSNEDMNVSEFFTAFNRFRHEEPSIRVMSDRIFVKEYNEFRNSNGKRTVIDMLCDYKINYFICGNNLNYRRLYKLCSDELFTTNNKEFRNINYIDYQKQLINGNDIIHDEGIAGLWAFTANTTLKYIKGDYVNSQFVSEHENRIYVVSPVEDCYYLDTGTEVIGDKYKVEFSTSLPNNKSDLGKLIMYLLEDYRIDKN